MKAFLAASVAFFACSTTKAQFTINPGGTQNSVGEIGNSGNSVFTSNYTGPTSLFGTFAFNGTLTSTTPDTWGWDSGLSLLNTTSAFGVEYFPSDRSDTFTTLDISRTHGGLFWFAQNDILRVETFESFDDAVGADARWANINLTFHNSVSAIVLGSFDEGALFDFDTFGSSYDTELALFTKDGVLIASNDDTDGLQSQIDVGQLAAGDYYLTVGGWDSFFGNGFAIGGVGFGDFRLNLNGVDLMFGTSNSDQLATFSFTINPVPEPSALLLCMVGVSVYLLSRRRVAH